MHSDLPQTEGAILSFVQGHRLLLSVRNRCAKTLGSIQNLWFSELSKILSKRERERSHFERLLVTAIDLFGTAMNQSNSREAYLNFVTALESLLLKEKEPRGLLAERVAIIAGESYEAREDLFNDMEHIYDVRSKIVHSGFTDVIEDDLWLCLHNRIPHDSEIDLDVRQNQRHWQTCSRMLEVKIQRPSIQPRPYKEPAPASST